MTTHWRQRLWYRPVRPRRHWPRWLAIGLGAAVLAVLLGGCGTTVVADGEACGRPFKLRLGDFKDRSSFEATITCPDGGSIQVASSESSTSAVLAAQADLLDRLAGLVTQLASPISFEQTARMYVPDAPRPVLRPQPIAWPKLKPEE